MRLFDMHCDTVYECVTKHQSLYQNTGHLDLVRGLRYDSWAQAMAVWMPDSLRGEAAFAQCCNMLAWAHEQERIHADCLKIVSDKRDLDDALRQGRCAVILTVEGGSALAGRLDALETLRQLGVKAITLTWNGSNELGHGCLSDCRDGLTEFGKQAVRAMESHHIIPDVSHLNEAGFWDVMESAAGKVIATHSVSAAVHSFPRNLTDAQFAAIRDRGGVVGLNLCEAHLGEQTFDCLARHFDHYLSLGGERTVGFGCDLDGTDLPDSWGGVAVMETLYEYFLRKNYEESLLDRLFFSNCYDFFSGALTIEGR